MNMDIHHRCPRSQGGTNEDWNISNVPHSKHVAWHNLFGNAHALHLPYFLSKYFPKHSFITLSLSSTRVALAPVTGICTKRKKVEKSIRALFKGKTIAQIVHELNSTWIDPHFALQVVSVPATSYTFFDHNAGQQTITPLSYRFVNSNYEITCTQEAFAPLFA